MAPPAPLTHRRQLALLFAIVQAKGIPGGKEWEAVATYLPGNPTAKAVSERWRRLNEAITKKGLLDGDKDEEDAAGPVKEAPKEAAAKPKAAKKSAKAVEDEKEGGGAGAIDMFSEDEGVELATADEHEREHFEVESPDKTKKKTTARKPKAKAQAQAQAQAQAAHLASWDGNGSEEVQVEKSPTPGPKKRGPGRPKGSTNKGKKKEITAVAKTGLKAEDSGIEDMDQEGEVGEVVADTPPASTAKKLKVPLPKPFLKAPPPAQHESEGEEDHVD